MSKAFEEVLWNLRVEFERADLTPEKESELLDLLEKVDDELCALRVKRFLRITHHAPAQA